MIKKSIFMLSSYNWNEIQSREKRVQGKLDSNHFHYQYRTENRLKSNDNKLLAWLLSSIVISKLQIIDSYKKNPLQETFSYQISS